MDAERIPPKDILLAPLRPLSIAYTEKKLNTPWEFFEYGLKLVLARWTALRMAIEGSWGGGDSARKYDILLEEILNVFKYQKKVQPYDLELNISDYVESEFGLVCEDGSIEALVNHLLTVAAECKQGDYASVKNLHEKTQTFIPICLKDAKVREPKMLSTLSLQYEESEKTESESDGWISVRRSTRCKIPTKVYDPQAEFPGAQ